MANNKAGKRRVGRRRHIGRRLKRRGPVTVGACTNTKNSDDVPVYYKTGTAPIKSLPKSEIDNKIIADYMVGAMSPERKQDADFEATINAEHVKEMVEETEEGIAVYDANIAEQEMILQPTENKMMRRYSTTDLNHALACISHKQMSVRAASKKFGVPHQTLYARMKHPNPFGEQTRGPAPTVPPEIEAEVVQHALNRARMGYQTTRLELCVLTKNLLDAAGIKTTFSENLPSLSWLQRFTWRHPLLQWKTSTTVPFKPKSDKSQLDHHMTGKENVDLDVAPVCDDGDWECAGCSSFYSEDESKKEMPWVSCDTCPNKYHIKCVAKGHSVVWQLIRNSKNSKDFDFSCEKCCNKLCLRLCCLV